MNEIKCKVLERALCSACNRVSDRPVMRAWFPFTHEPLTLCALCLSQLAAAIDNAKEEHRIAREKREKERPE